VLFWRRLTYTTRHAATSPNYYKNIKQWMFLTM